MRPDTSSGYSRRRWGWLLLVAVLLAMVPGYVALDRWQRQLIFSVEADQRSWWREPPERTEVFDLPISNGEHVRAWYWPQERPDAPTVLYLHGARWNLNGSAFRFEQLGRQGFSVLAIDYRGFGDSSPRLPSLSSARADAQAAMRELARRQPRPERRFIYGHSLGGAIAVDLATSKDTPDFAGLIVEAGFTRIADMLQTQSWGDLPGLRWLITQPFDSLSRLPGLRQPLLVIHGTADRTVPHLMGDALYQAALLAPRPPSRVVKIDGASHSNASRSGLAYEEPLRQFVGQAIAWMVGEAP